jgi:glycosyltransferase involved in cell wall biosynthesis
MTDTDTRIDRTGEDGDAVNRLGDASRPLVSAVVTTYERPVYLRKAVRSVLDQTYAPVELVVVDDRSETPARQILAEMELDELAGVQCVRHEENRGANAARNSGIEASSGEYIAFLDDDDRWKPPKLARQVEAFRESTEDVGLVYTGVEKVSENDVYERIPPAIDGDITKSLLCRNVVGGTSVAMVRADLATAVPFDERFPAWADLEWFINLSQRADFERLPEPLVVYEYRSPNKLSDDLEKKRTAYRLFIEEFDPVAARYGRLFRRKMRAWAAYRFGNAAFKQERYALAWRYFAAAVSRYPFETRFTKYLAVSSGGKLLHGVAKSMK